MDHLVLTLGRPVRGRPARGQGAGRSGGSRASTREGPLEYKGGRGGGRCPSSWGQAAKEPDPSPPAPGTGKERLPRFRGFSRGQDLQGQGRQ